MTYLWKIIWKRIISLFLDRKHHNFQQDEEHYTYKERNKNQRTGDTYYMCTEMFEYCCKAKAVYRAKEGLAEFSGRHTHQANPQKVEAMLRERNVLETMVNCGPTQEQNMD